MSEHNHRHADEMSREEAIALLGYMAEHNRHHAEELHEISHTFGDEIAEILHTAVGELENSAVLIEKALKMTEG